MSQPHLDRARAESFGSIAEPYDSHRPTYAEAMFADLAALRPRDVLDIGCGTGMVAAGLLHHGLDVLGVEPDEQMAEIARARGIPVEVATFEGWDEAGRQFDLLTCGAAWHWIDPVLGLEKAARLLRSGATLARCWNFEVPDEPARSAMEAVYSELEPNATRYVPSPAGWPEPVEADDEFNSTDKRLYEWPRTRSAANWVQMATTFSDHQGLGAERLTELQQALIAAIERVGGAVHAHGGTYVLLKTRA